jgi:hypothetical protein
VSELEPYSREYFAHLGPEVMAVIQALIAASSIALGSSDLPPGASARSANGAEPMLFDAETAIERMGLKGRKSQHWLKQEARAERIPCTRVGKTLMGSERDLADIVAQLRCEPRNARRRR